MVTVLSNMLYAVVVSKANARTWTAVRLWALGPKKPYTIPSRSEGFRRLLMNQWGFFTKAIQSGALSNTNASITGNSSNVLSSFGEQGIWQVHGVEEGSQQEGIRDNQCREDTVSRVVQLMPQWQAQQQHQGEGWRASNRRYSSHEKVSAWQ